jgi:hypothetical protein
MMVWPLNEVVGKGIDCSWERITAKDDMALGCTGVRWCDANEIVKKVSRQWRGLY